MAKEEPKKEVKETKKSVSKDTLIYILIIVVILLASLCSYLLLTRTTDVIVNQDLPVITDDGDDITVEEDEGLEEETETEAELTPIDVLRPGQGDIPLLAEVPVDAEVIIDVDTLTTEVNFSNSKLSFYVLDMNPNVEFIEYTLIENPNLEELYRVETTQGYYYTTNVELSDQCITDITTVDAPCGTLTVEFGDSEDYFTVRFEGDESEIEKADALMKTLSM